MKKQKGLPELKPSLPAWSQRKHDVKAAGTATRARRRTKKESKTEEPRKQRQNARKTETEEEGSD